MDEQPSTPTTPLPPGEEATPTDAATVTLPPETPPTATAQPSSQTFDYHSLDYQSMLDEHPIPGMHATELATIFPDAHRVIHDFPGGAAFQETEGIGDSPALMRALGRLGADLRVADEAEADYLQALPKGTTVQVPPLTGQALHEFITELLRDRLDVQTRRLVEMSGALETADGRQWLEAVAQRLWRQHHLLPALERATKDHRTRQEAQREAHALAQASPAVQAMSQTEYDAAYAKAFREWKAADDAGDTLGKQVANAEMDRLARARYGG